MKQKVLDDREVMGLKTTNRSHYIMFWSRVVS